MGVFEVEVRRPHDTTGTVTVQVVSSSAGEATETVALDVDGLLRRLGNVQQAVLLSSVASRRLVDANEQEIREVGQALFTALLGTGEVAGRYRAGAAVAESQGEGFRVVVRLEDPALAALPWEVMYDPGQRQYVCRRDQLVRRVPVGRVPTPLPVAPPLRVLAVLSSPRGLPTLDVDKEKSQLTRALSRLTAARRIEVHWAEEATWAHLQYLLLTGTWHAIHFVGHGDFDTDQDTGVLALVGEDGRADRVEADRFVDLLRQARPMPRLIVLNSCLGGSSGQVDLFAGTAAALVQGGATAVAAMQFEITDAAAIAFSRGFYTAIANGRGVDDAVSSGRAAIVGLSGRTLEWVTPVLYLRGENTQLFTLTAGPEVDAASGRDATPPGDRDAEPHRQTVLPPPPTRTDPGAPGPAERRRPGALARGGKAAPSYVDFDLLIDTAVAGGYRARVLSSPTGETRPVPVTIPFSDLEIENFLLRIGRPRRRVTRGVGSPEAAAVREFGGRLFDAVFREAVRTALISGLAQVEGRENTGLRIRLRLADTPELADLPWEMLHDSEIGRFLALSRWTPVVRYVDLPRWIRPLRVQPPLRILLMTAGPTDFPPLDAATEWQKVREALDDLVADGRVQVDRVPTGRLADLRTALRTGDYHVFHFVGHGRYDPEAQDGVLALEGPRGRAQLLSGADLGALLSDHRSVRLALLNSCEGARGGRVDPYSGTAQSLVHQGLPGVVAMQFEMTDEAAFDFTQTFFSAVADGLPLDVATADAREAIRMQPNNTEWATPALYLRGPDGRVFDITGS